MADTDSTPDDVDVSDIVDWLDSHPLDELHPFDREEYLDRLARQRYRTLVSRFARYVRSVRRKRPISLEIDTDNSFVIKPPIALIQGFLMFLLKTCRGKLAERLTVNTLRKQWRDLKRAIRIKAKAEYSLAEDLGIKRWIRGYCVEKLGASTKVMPKPLISVVVTDDIIHFLWAYDFYRFRHERYRAQLWFLLNLFTYKGVRPGEVVESNCWFGSNEGLHYQDIEILRIRIGKALIYTMRIALRYRKGHRGDAEET
jgi:hypothetical protein